MAQGALAEAISHLDVRFGARTVTTATAAADRAGERRFVTGTSLDRLADGIAPGSAVALTGEGSCGKVTLAYRAVAGAQASGGMALWVDPARSLDPVSAWRCGVDLRRLIVVRARTLAEVTLAAGAALRSVGFRLVVVDLGPSFAQVGSADQLEPLLANARGSTSALVIVSDHPPRRISLPVLTSEKAA
ncbi:MAG: hypothetical protein HYX56_02495 [Chloroflexi bacterium]|nr:hypothetical protein [Chloroflexota bacterium]